LYFQVASNLIYGNVIDKITKPVSLFFIIKMQQLEKIHKKRVMYNKIITGVTSKLYFKKADIYE